MAAADKGKVDLVRALLRYEVDANATPKPEARARPTHGGLAYKYLVQDCIFRETPLHAAVMTTKGFEEKYLETIDLLLQGSYLIDEKDSNKRTASHLATYSCATSGNSIVDFSVVTLLLKRGAAVNNYTTGKDHDTALHIAIVVRGPTELITELLAWGAEINARDAVENTPLIIAAANGDTHIVTILLEHGASVTLKDNEGNTALDLAVKEGHRGVEKLLRASI